MPPRGLDLRVPGLLSLGALLSCAGGRLAPAAPSPGAAAPSARRSVRPITFSPADTGLPSIPVVHGPLQLKVVYPAPTDLVEVKDSSFLFGSTGTGDAVLAINGVPVRVWPNGAWVAWLAFPPDTIMTFELRARTATDSSSLSYTVRRPRRTVPPPLPVWIDSLSIAPRGRVWWPRGEYLPVTVRAAEGASVRIRLPDGTVVPLQADVRPEDVLWGVRAFERDTTVLRQPLRADRYAGVIRGVALGPDPGPVVGPAVTPAASPAINPSGCGARAGCMRRGAATSADTIGPVIEAIIGADSVRVRWNIQLAMLDSLPTVVTFDDDTARTGNTDRLTVGRARPGGTYYWFFPTGTRANVSGRIGDDLRLALSRTSEAWVNVADALPLPKGTPALRATVGSVVLTPHPGELAFRVPLSQQVPYLVTETERGLALRIYGAVSDVNWLRYGGTDPYVRQISWKQSADEVVFDLELAGPVWGYRTRWDGHDLILEIRRPPVIDPARPFAGRLIEVDPGHPPLGATGPTGLPEAEANLSVALKLRDLLEAAGATVIMTRTTDTAVDLWPRVRLADSLNVELLVSIHNNALPDGVEPFRNSGSSVFYNHPRSLPLAFAIQRALVHRLGVRNLGVSRGDLALARPTWMPAVLCEGLFMTIPEQEAALRSPDGQRRYAMAVFEGMEEFLRLRARAPGL